MSSLTTKVFPLEPGWYWVYYIINNIQELVTALTQDHPVVLMFWADWDQPSEVMVQPYYDMADAKRHEAVFCRLDFHKFKDVAEKFGVKVLPTFLLIKEGEEQRRVVGTRGCMCENPSTCVLYSVCP